MPVNQKSFETRSFSALRLLLLALFCTLASTCDNGSDGPKSGGGGDATVEVPNDEKEPARYRPKKEKKPTNAAVLPKDSTVLDSGADFQVKNIEILRSSISSCLSPDFLKVTEDMILPAQGDPEIDPGDGRLRFLLPVPRYQAGDDIIDKERRNLVDTSSAGRTGLAADSLTDTYLRSLEIVANVAAHHCDLRTPAKSALCRCDTQASARTLLERCLPGIDPNTQRMDDAIEIVYLKCTESEDPEDLVKNMRTAIASLLSSYAFAAAR